jgi:DnaK suppressor protein
MKAKDRDKFTKILQEKRLRIIQKAQHTLESGMTLDEADLPDEMDLASSEYLQSFQFRLRGRERTFLAKIDKALTKIDEGTFGVCEDCGAAIHPKRLAARPETNLCIKCKEEQEREEKQFGE